MWGGREGVSQFSVKHFCLTVPKNFVGQHFSVSLTSGIEKKLWWEMAEGRERVSRFSVKTFCLAVAKNFAGERFCAVVCKTYVNEKTYRWGREEGMSIKVLRWIFFFTVAKKFVWQSFSVSLFSGIKKNCDKRGRRRGREYHNFLWKIFVPQYQKIS